MTKEQILAEIAKLDAELKKETEEIRKEGYTIQSQYNPITNRDTLLIAKYN